jgi:sigma-54 specific flagellar transcriptional regulator A
VAQVKGRFESTTGGTLFLDEIGDMPGVMQVKLLRVLEERTVTRVGSRTPIPIDTRIISATHRDIDSAIRQQSFREDLFYRLAVFPIHVPSLAERIEDVPQLLAYFLDTLTPRIPARARGNRPDDGASLAGQCPRAEEFRRAWLHPARGEDRGCRGNRCADPPRHAAPPDGAAGAVGGDRPRANGGAIRNRSAAADRPADHRARPAPDSGLAEPSEPIDLKSIVAGVEHDHIRRALDQANGVVADAARLLSLQRTTLIEKMNKYGLRKPG